MELPLGTLSIGALLWALTIAPSNIHHPVHHNLARLPLYFTLDTIIFTLKWLLGIGIIRNVNAALNAAALNNGLWFSDKSRWNWPKEVAVVTGGCSGIGEATVKALAKKGVRVAVLDMAPLPEKLKNVAAHYEKCDVSDPASVNAAAKAVKAKLGPVSILVNNAGIGNAGAILDVEPAKVKKLFEVNLISHWYMCQAFVPDMVKANKGHIVEIASLSSFVNVSNFADYSASKTALVSFSDSLRDSMSVWYKAPNVHVTNVHPSYIATPLTGADALEKKAGKMPSADFAAGEITGRIFSCRGSQLIVPSKFNAAAYIRSFPFWVQRRIRLAQTFTQEQSDRVDQQVAAGTRD